MFRLNVRDFFLNERARPQKPENKQTDSQQQEGRRGTHVGARFEGRLSVIVHHPRARSSCSPPNHATSAPGDKGSRRLLFHQHACVREIMDMEPLQLMRGMDVDLGMGLGDDLGGFEGFDAIFAEPNSTTDFFKSCALEEAQEQEDAMTTSTFQGPPSPVTAFGQQQHQQGNDFAQESWNAGAQEQVQAWLATSLSTSEPTRNPNALLHHHSGGKPRARKRHDEDEALEAEESALPLMKVS